MSRVSSALLATCLLWVAVGCSRGIQGEDIEAVAPGEWLSYGRSYGDQRYSPLDAINRDTVARLGLAWWAEFDTDRGQEATPLMHDGVLFTTTSWSKVHAFDARSGKRLWSYDPQVPGEKGFDACCDVVNRGLALWGGRVYVASLDGRLIALDAQSGKRVWEVATVDPSQSYTVTGAPLAVKGLIVIGNGGADRPSRGYLSAYDARSGKLRWRFYTAPNPTGEPDGAASDRPFAEFANKTWGPGAWQLGGGGGNPWDAITYDPQTGLLLFGTGNAGPWNDKFRSPEGGDNLFTAAIVALRPETGEYVWHYQTTPADAWDYDSTPQLMVADLPIDGALRHVVMQASKNGFYYVLDVATGKLLSAEKFVPVTWAERVDLQTGRPVEVPGVRYHDGVASRQTPGPAGAHSWQPMAYHPAHRLVYLSAHSGGGYYSDPEKFTFIPGAQNTGLGQRFPPPEPRVAGAPPPPPPNRYGELVAWDPVKQAARWRLRFPQMWRSGVLATGGDLVFHAAGHEFAAFDAGTGERRWSFDTVVSVVAPAMSYELDGVQYIAVMAGYGGAAAPGGQEPRRPGRLLVFKLDGQAVAQAYPEHTSPGPLDLSLAVASAGNARAGQDHFMMFCAPCHGRGEYLPNLTRSPLVLVPEAFQSVVLDGARASRGMASFRRFLDASAVEDVRAYLLQEAKLAGSGPAAALGEGDHAQ